MNRIFVIEDDAELREAIRIALEANGFQVRCAQNGREAIARLRTDKAGLILLDLTMPEMDGWDFRREQNLDPRLASIPVVVMTARKGFERSFIDAQDWVAKPLELDDLVATVQRWCPTVSETPPAPLDDLSQKRGSGDDGQVAAWLSVIRPRLGRALGETHPLCAQIDRAVAVRDVTRMKELRDLFADDALPNEERQRIGPLPAPPGEWEFD